MLYLLAGLAAACVLAVAEVASGEEPDIGPAERLGYVLNHVWPAVLTVFAVAVPSFRTKLAGMVIAAAVIWVGMRLVEDVDSWVEAVWAPTALLALVANRWLKNIAPLLVMVVLFVGWAAAMSSMSLIAGLYPLAIGALLLFLIVHGYERKYFSDLSFHLGFLWTVFSLWYVTHETMSLWWSAVAAVLAYALITRLTLPVLRREARRHRPASLLVLRVFGAPSRSQRLFEELGTRWRYIGPLHLIAGADSAVTNLDLSEAAHFFTFRVRSLYVSNRDDLERRLARLDTAPDPDGRYRVNDFFCFEDTWKPTFTRLLAVSDVVLVDLSGFGPQHTGVAFELEQLLARRPLDSFVLVTDDRTDADHLSATLTRLWRALDPSLPNARAADPVLRVFHNPRPEGLMAALCDAAVVQRSAGAAHYGS